VKRREFITLLGGAAVARARGAGAAVGDAWRHPILSPILCVHSMKV
jgi:hypothetical protein